MSTLPMLKPLLRLYHPRFVFLQKHLFGVVPRERDMDWEDYNYEWEPVAGGERQAENPLRLYWQGIGQGSLTSTQRKLDALLP